MVKEIIGSILEAEESADKIIKDANAKAHENVLNAVERAEKIRQDIKEEMRLKAKTEYAKSEEAGSNNAEKIIEFGKNKAIAMKKSAEKNADEAVSCIIRRLTEV